MPEASEVPTNLPEEDRGEDRGEMLMLIYNTNVAWEPTILIFKAYNPYFLAKNLLFS